MKTPIHGQPEHVRRARQRDIGLDIQQPQPEKRNDTMQEPTTQQQQSRRQHQSSRAFQSLEHLTMPPTYRGVVMQELKRASVYAPILFTTIVGALWVNKKLILKAATSL